MQLYERIMEEWTFYLTGQLHVQIFMLVFAGI